MHVGPEGPGQRAELVQRPRGRTGKGKGRCGCSIEKAGRVVGSEVRDGREPPTGP